MGLKFFLAFLLAFNISCAFSNPKTASDNAEIILLIDVSGSMKANDPGNLRIPATKLLINLLKNRASLAIFTFSTYTKLLSPLNLVTDEYEKNFNYKKDKINSTGQHTNILTALQEASKAFKGSQKRYIVLLTDGKIDTGSIIKDDESKKIIGSQIITEFKKKNIKVYPIGLGTNIDQELLNSLAYKTNGLYHHISSMSDAENRLYDIFTSVIPAQGIPLEKEDLRVRTIRVDRSITELSIIVAKVSHDKEVVLYKPDGKRYVADNIKNYTKFIFIHIKNPVAGIWKLKGDEQAVERAIILTNLELISNKLDGKYFNRELINFSSRLQLGGESQELFKLIGNTEVLLSLKNAKGSFSTPIPFTSNTLFKKQFILDLPPGITNSTITAKNNSFLRENQSIFEVLPTPFIQKLEDKSLNLQLVSPDIIADSVKINLVDIDENFSLPLFQNNGMWQANFADICKLTTLKKLAFYVKIEANTTNQREITLILPECRITCDQVKPSVNVVHKTSSSISTKRKPDLTVVENPKQKPLMKIENNHDFYKWLVITLLVFFIILIFISGFLYRRNRLLFQEKIDELEEDDDTL